MGGVTKDMKGMRLEFPWLVGAGAHDFSTLFWEVIKFIRGQHIEANKDLAGKLAYFTDKTGKILIQKDLCTPMFIIAFFTKAKIWKQTKCLLIDEWMKKLWYVYNGILVSHTK